MEDAGSRAVCDPGIAIALFLAAVVPRVNWYKHRSSGGCGRVAFVVCCSREYCCCALAFDVCAWYVMRS